MAKNDTAAADNSAVDQTLDTTADQPNVTAIDQTGLINTTETTGQIDSAANPNPIIPARLNVRVLTDIEINSVKIPAGRVIAISGADAAGLIAGGCVDPHPDAVAYALTENADIINPFQ